MKKVTKLVLMLCLILSGAFCYASGVARTENEKGKGIFIEIIEKINHGGSDRSSAIVTTLNDHVLSVAFTENLGEVSIEVATISGESVQYILIQTPNGLQIYIPNAGNYIITFTLPDGDEYYGEFTIME